MSLLLPCCDRTGFDRYGNSLYGTGIYSRSVCPVVGCSANYWGYVKIFMLRMGAVCHIPPNTTDSTFPGCAFIPQERVRWFVSYGLPLLRWNPFVNYINPQVTEIRKGNTNTMCKSQRDLSSGLLALPDSVKVRLVSEANVPTRRKAAQTHARLLSSSCLPSTDPTCKPENMSVFIVHTQD